MLIDLHVHTRPRSACSSLSPDELIEAAKAAGLDGLCLTEHDALWSQAEAAALAARHRFLVLRGAEITTELGHVLVFGLERLATDVCFAWRLREHVTAAGGVMALAHPFRSGGPVDRGRTAGLFDALEAVNGSDGPALNRSAAGLAGGLRLPGLGGSDAHALHEVGTAATLFEVPVRDEETFLAALRAGRYRAVDLRGRTGVPEA